MTSPREIELKSDALANMLDNGESQRAANALRNESYNMDPREFRALVTRTNDKEDNRLGDNLTITRNGDVVIQTGDRRNIMIANLNDQTGRYPQVREPHQPRCYYEQPKDHNDGKIIGAIGGAIGGALLGGRHNRGEGAVIGGILGTIGGAAVDERNNNRPNVVCPEDYERRR